MYKPIQRPYLDSAVLQKGWEEHFPNYLFDEYGFYGNLITWKFLRLTQALMRAYMWLALRPRQNKIGKLDLKEVEGVYNREAETYDLKHHHTTRGQDTVWRRFAAHCAIAMANKNRGHVRVLDLCTGTGLTIVEISRVFESWSVSADIIGFDYNAEMLARAQKRKYPPKITVDFVRGDAKRLEEVSGIRNIDLITQVFGIGGIDNPLLVFGGVIKTLKPYGQFLLIDMHRPIPSLPGEWPLFFKWLSLPLFEAMTYEETTIPLALNRLWGWRDTTLDFYLLPLVTCQEKNGKCFGWRVLNRSVVSERWWFGLPIMPTATILVEKVEISKHESAKRKRILESAIV